MINWLCFIFVGTLGWGISLFLIKILLVSVSPLDLVIYRMAIGSITLCIFVCILKMRPYAFAHFLRDGIIIGLFNVAIPFYLIAEAEKNISSSLASVVNGLTPIFTYVFGILFFTTTFTFTLYSMLSLLCGFIGVVILEIDCFQQRAGMIDLIYLLGASLSYAIAANYIKQFTYHREPILVATIAAIVATLMLIVFKFSNESFTFIWHLPENRQQVTALLWLGVISSGISFYLYCLLIKNLGQAVATQITYLMIMTGVLAGSIFLNEDLSKATIFGCLFIFFSFMLASSNRFFFLKNKRL